MPATIDLVGPGLGRDLDAGVRLALVVEHHQVVLVLRLRIGVPQLHREIGRVPAAEADGGVPAGERTDERQLHRVLGPGGQRDQEDENGEAKERRPSSSWFPPGQSARDLARRAREWLSASVLEAIGLPGRSDGRRRAALSAVGLDFS